MNKCKYFKIQELVSKKVYDKYGESAWRFIDDRLVETLDLLRELIGKPITVNNWCFNGSNQQRGLRSNMDEIIYKATSQNKINLSQHCFGKAVDFNVKNMTSKEVVDFIILNKDKFKYIKRIENVEYTPTWVHIDLANTGANDIVIFNP